MGDIDLRRKTDAERQRRHRRTAKLAMLRAEATELEQELERHTDFDADRMRAAVNRAFTKTLQLIDTAEHRHMQGLSISLGVLIDKRRLIDGMATSRHESVTPTAAAELDRMREAARGELRRLHAVPYVGTVEPADVVEG